jgi:hypothetical protein
MKNMSKNTKLSIGAIIIVIIGALIFRYGGHKKPVEVAPEPIPVVEQPAAAKLRPRRVSPEAVVPPADNRGYAELIASYKDHMVQFGDSCQVRVSDQVYKLGSEMLLDNRNNTPLTIKIGSNSYDLGAYGHQVITLGSEGKFMIDCGVNQNVATLTVQK